MKVRTRLVASFAYVLLVVIVALTVPLAIVLRDRARSELKALTLTNAQTIGAVLNGDRLDEDPAVRRRLTRDAERYAADVGGRVVILDANGTVLVDSEGEDLGDNFATAGRPEVTQALASRATADVRRSDEEGGDIAVGAAPILDEGQLVGAVRISRGVRTVQENVSRATLAIAAVALGGLLAGLILAFALARSLSRPLTRLAGTARRFGDGDLTTRAGDVEGDEEIEELAHSFDEMAERVERTVRAQREFVANASHQLRTPLTGIKLRLEGAIADTTDPRIREELRAADQEVDRLAQIIQRLLTMAARIEEGTVARADLGDAVDRAIARWRDRATHASATLTTNGAADMWAVVDRHDVDQVLDVLIDNALTYAPGPIEVRATAEGDRVGVSVADHGPGIPVEEASRVTERFYRGHGAPAGGSGLGLAIARELAERWGGALEIGGGESGAASGARIDVWFRRDGAEQA